MMALAIVLVFVIAAVVVAIIFYLAVGSTSPADGHGCGARFTGLKDRIPFQSLKIVVVSWQIITQFSEAANAIYPESYERFLAIVGLSNLDLAGFLTARCLISTDFHDRLLFSTLGPIAVLGVLACTYAFATRIRDPGDDESRTTIKSKHASIALLVAFLVYGSVSSTVFGMFACEDLDDGGSYLRGDYSIRCDSGKHRGLMVYAGVMILVYPLGIPALFAWLLYSNRDKLSNRESDGGDEEPTVRPLSNGKKPPVNPLAGGKDPAVESLVKDKDPAVNLLAKDGDPAAKPLPRDKDPTVKPFAELWQPYKPEMYLYELLVYLRRILLTGLVVFIFPNTAAQVAVTFMIELFFFVLSVFLLPYADRVPPTRRPKIWLPHANAWLSHVSHVVVLVSLYLALLLKVDISDETDPSQQVFAGVLIAVHCLMILSVVVQAVLSMYNDVEDFKEETEWPSAREIFEDILGTRGPSARELPDPLRKSQRSTASTSATKMDEEKTASEKSPHELESEQRPEAPADQLVSPAPSS